MPSERQIQRAVARGRAMLERGREAGLLPPKDDRPPAKPADPPATDDTVPAGRNPSGSRVRQNPPPHNYPKPEKELEEEQETREVSFAKHVRPHVSEAKNGLHTQLEQGAKKRLKLRS